MDRGAPGYAATMEPDDRPTTVASALVDLPARAGGSALAGVITALSLARRAAKPLHPRGRVVEARVVRHGGSRAAGVPWLDEAGEDAALVRLSRSVGLPAPLPDIHGLALRVPADSAPGGDREGSPDGSPPGGPGDLLLATTGRGPVGRFVLTPGRNVAGRVFTSLMPYRTDRGPVLLGAISETEDSFELCWATPGGAWVPFGRLEVTGPDAGDPAVSFDPVVHQLPGLESYRWARRLRVPSYATARRHSGRST